MAEPSQSQTHSPLYLAVFDSLRAEQEAEWLGECFVPPPEFDFMAGARSALIFGAVGMGKTAVFRAMRERCYKNGKPVRLVVHWRMLTLDPLDTLLELTEPPVAPLAEILDGCVEALLGHIAIWPDTFRTAPDWAKDRLTRFIHRHSLGDLRTRSTRLLQSEVPGVGLIQELLSQLPDLDSDAADRRTPGDFRLIAMRFVDALAELGLQGVWVMSDEFGQRPAQEQRRLAANLATFLADPHHISEVTHFTWKLLVPQELADSLLGLGNLEHHLLESYTLHWEVEDLHAVVEERLSLALGRHPFTLEDLCEGDGLARWLERTAADSPREWLYQVRPLVDHFIRHAKGQPIKRSRWKNLRRVPRLVIDKENLTVRVGRRDISISDLPGKAWDLLLYLSNHSNQIVSKTELYYKAHKGMNTLPKSIYDQGYEDPVSYEGLMDTLLYRIRQTIEPDSEDPALVETIRGRGVRLVQPK